MIKLSVYTTIKKLRSFNYFKSSILKYVHQACNHLIKYAIKTATYLNIIKI